MSINAFIFGNNGEGLILYTAGVNYSRSGEVDFNSSIMQSGRNDFSKVLTSEEWKKYNNAITSGVDAGFRINDHSILVECEKGDYSYKLVIYDNTFEENPINAVYGIGKSSEPTTTNNFDEKYISEFITELEDRNYDNKQVFERILRPYSKNVGRVLGRYSSRDNRFIRYGRKISQSGANPQNQSNGAGASGTNQTNVKFDLRDNVEETKELVAVHNIYVNKCIICGEYKKRIGCDKVAQIYELQFAFC